MQAGINPDAARNSRETKMTEVSWPGGLLRQAAHLAIRFYQLTFSAIAGRWCSHLPTCSHYTDDAIRRHGLWAGGWIGLARICRCRPGGTSGFDPVPEQLPPNASPLKPWRYGRWRGGSL